MAIFDGISYTLSHSLSSSRRHELAAILDLNGATTTPPHTHLIALGGSYSHNTKRGGESENSTLKVVSDKWVDRSIVLGKLQQEQYYSPDPVMIFSGVVACATDLSSSDIEVLAAGVTALGGQWRIGLTRDVTHLFALRPGSDKYNTALHYAFQTHMSIITPHWFDDSVRLGRCLPETPYLWPDPVVLRSGALPVLEDNMINNSDGKRRNPARSDTAKDDLAVESHAENAEVWEGRRILLSLSLELSQGQRDAVEAGIKRAGGTTVDIEHCGDFDDAEEKAVNKCDVFVTRWRSGKAYFKAARASLMIGTLAWLFSVESSGTLHSSLDSLLWYPTPRGGVPGLVGCEISITNYTGAARDYLKRLISLMGAKFTPSLSMANKVLVAGFQPSPKTTRALTWSIPVVNHTWLEDCFVEWRGLTVGLERYIVFPPGIDFGKIIMRGDKGGGLSSSSGTLGGGAVPGARGVGIIDVNFEEERDNAYVQKVKVGDEYGDAIFQGGAIPSQQLRGNRARSNTGETERGRTVNKGYGYGNVERRWTRSRSRAARSASRSSSKGRTAAEPACMDKVIEILSDGADDSRPMKRRARGGSTSIPPLSKGCPPGSNTSTGEVEAAVALQDENESLVDADPTTSVSGRDNIRMDTDGESSMANEVQQLRAHVNPKGGSRGKGKALCQISSKGQPRVVENKDKGRPKPRSMAKSTVSQHPPSEPDQSPSHVGPTAPTTIRSAMKPKSRRAATPAVVDRNGNLDRDTQVVKRKKSSGIDPAKGMSVSKKIGRKDASKPAGRLEEYMVPRARSPLFSPAESPAKTANTPKEMDAVLVPALPEEYFSPNKEKRSSLKDENAVVAEASTSTRKQTNPTSTIKSTHATKHPTLKRATHQRNGSEDDGEGTSMITSMITESITAFVRDGPRRAAAHKASTKLRTEVMPDLVEYEKERKGEKRRRSMGYESRLPLSEECEVEPPEVKKRKIDKVGAAKSEKGKEKNVDQQDVVPVVVSTSKEKQTKQTKQTKTKATAHSDEASDDLEGGTGPHLSQAKIVRLMSTGVTLSDDVVKRLAGLGVKMTSKPTDCTHLITKGIVRTEKFLCAMSVSPYILKEQWATASIACGKLLSEQDYLLSDPAAEKKWKFNLSEALERCKQQSGGAQLLKQRTFYLTPKVPIDSKLLKNVVQASGGQVLGTTPTVRILKANNKRHVISCPEDMSIWRPLVLEGFKIYSPELILQGVLKQDIEWDNPEFLATGNSS